MKLSEYEARILGQVAKHLDGGAEEFDSAHGVAIKTATLEVTDYVADKVQKFSAKADVAGVWHFEKLPRQ